MRVGTTAAVAGATAACALLLAGSHAEAACGTQPPGFSFLASGFDLTTLDVLDLDSTDGQMLYALNHSCNQNISYVNAYTGETYSLPDQLDGFPINIGGDMTQVASIFASNAVGLREQVAASVGASVLFGLFSKSLSVFESVQFLTNQSVYAGVRQSHAPIYHMALHPPIRSDVMGLSADCQGLAAQLPPQFDAASFEAYEGFIGHCGTDYLQEATLGCKLQYRHYTGIGKVDVLGEAGTELNAQFDFLGLLKRSGAITHEVQAASRNYVKTTVSRTACYGNSPGCPGEAGASGSPATFAAWLKGCPGAPVVLSGQFSSLGPLVRDPATAASFEAARINHFNLAYLKNELIPLATLIGTLLDTPVALHDTSPGSVCTGATRCPAGGTTCDATDWWDCKCDGLSHGCGPFNNFSCPNQFYGPDVNATAERILDGIATWKKNLTDLVTTATAAAAGSIVSNTTLAGLSAQFTELLVDWQTAVEQQSCSWTFATFETPCTLQCNAATGPLANTNVTRNITFIPALAK